MFLYQMFCMFCIEECIVRETLIYKNVCTRLVGIVQIKSNILFVTNGIKEQKV